MFLFLMAAPAGGAQGGDGMSQIIQTVVMFGSIIGIFYFMMIRPQQKRAKEHAALLAAVKKGDKVITSAGMHGSVHEVDEKSVTVTVANGVNIKFEKSSISSVNPA